MAATATSETSEGPVMAFINKRLRALRKKHNRITQMEESISQGKTLNKEQEEVLRSKPSVLVLIEELEKLRAPLSAAVSEEISLATQHPSHQSTAPEKKEGGEIGVAEASSRDGGSKVELEDLVNILYFGSLFDVKSQNEFTSTMLTRTHERGCCLTYDYVTDDATEMLGEGDLDSISKLWSLMVSRPVDSSLSHKNALERCIEHAKLWLSNSDQPIESANVSYAGLREKLKKIMASDYFTTTPEMKAPIEVSAAACNYAPVEAATGHCQQKEEDASNCKEQESVVNDQSVQDEHQKDRSVTGEGEAVHGQDEQGYTQVEAKHTRRDHEQQYVPRGSNQNQRGGGGRRGGRRGYSNGRGGRGGGGYPNGNGNSGGNGYSRSYYNNRGGARGGVGGGGNGHSYSNHQDANATVAS